MTVMATAPLMVFLTQTKLSTSRKPNQASGTDRKKSEIQKLRQKEKHLRWRR
jgi:hypothetical protein